MKAVGRRRPEIIEPHRRLDHRELPDLRVRGAEAVAAAPAG